MILDSFRIEDQVAVVTGGTRGIGKAIALALAQAGADVAVVSRTPNPELEGEIGNLNRRYIHVPADFMNRSETQTVIPRILGEWGRIDVLVNNSGMIRRSKAIDFTEEDWDVTLEVNLTSTFILSLAAGREMAKKGKGKIVNIASVMAFEGGVNIAYTASKHAIAGLTKALSNEWASKGINVNAIAPGYFVTEMTTAVHEHPELYEVVKGRTSVRRWGDPSDIAGAAVFLASSASEYCHGIVLPVDGGWLSFSY